MKILIVATSDIGGAAKACIRLHEGLLAMGVDSDLLLLEHTGNTERTVAFELKGKPEGSLWKSWVTFLCSLRPSHFLEQRRIVKNHQYRLSRTPGLEAFNHHSSEFDLTESEWVQQADLIHVHWVAGFLDFTDFFKKNKKPVVWTLHDMNPFTGGEHYSESYLGMDEQGRPVPRMLTDQEIALFEENIQIKAELVECARSLTVVAPSAWLTHEAQNSPVFRHREVKQIPYGIDPERYQPRDRVESRRAFSIPEGKKVILFVADSISVQRKGYAYLKKAMESMDDEDVVLCAVGSKHGTLETDLHLMELGPVLDEHRMSQIYSAADVFVIPSLMDNSPNTVIESLLCGTPVIGFPVGGIVEMIQPGVNGFLATEISSTSLQNEIHRFLENPEIFDRNAIRERAVETYSSEIQAKEYLHLYEEILKEEGLPAFSIILPTYHCGKILSKALDSILNQGFTDYEVLLMDGGSDQETLSVIEAYQKKSHKIRFFQEEDEGIYDAMNKGIEAARGTWLYFMGCDDVLYDTGVLEDVSKSVAGSDLDVLYGNVDSKHHGGIYDGEFTYEKMVEKNLCHQSVFYKKNLFAITGTFDLQYKVWSDWDHNLKWFFRNRFKRKYFDRIIAEYGAGGFSSGQEDEVFKSRKAQIILKRGVFKVTPEKLLNPGSLLFRKGPSDVGLLEYATCVLCYAYVQVKYRLRRG